MGNAVSCCKCGLRRSVLQSKTAAMQICSRTISIIKNKMSLFRGRNYEKNMLYCFWDTRVKRSEIRCKLACKRIFDLGTRQNMNKQPFFVEK
ncbi:hypothetical protein B5E84_15610 [Lachnoclostridium sp. An14]|nr:hypothetical protein B5E84_15610 [Lachnoclostridium sp. An14]